MTIYNKSGFVWGIFWTILGVARLALLVIVPEDSTAQLVKGLVLGIFMLILGVTMFRRAFSKQATREDIFEKTTNATRWSDSRRRRARRRCCCGRSLCSWRRGSSAI